MQTSQIIALIVAGMTIFGVIDFCLYLSIIKPLMVSRARLSLAVSI